MAQGPLLLERLGSSVSWGLRLASCCADQRVHPQPALTAAGPVGGPM